jgi:superfamily II DNA or RNA helicase
MISLTHDQIEKALDSNTFKRGLQYYKKGRVIDLSVSQDGTSIEGEVQGSELEPYQVMIELSYEKKTNSLEVEGECNCFVGYNCKHVAALLLEAAELPQYQNLPTQSHRSFKNNELQDHELKENPDQPDSVDAILKAFASNAQKKAPKSEFDHWLNYFENHASRQSSGNQEYKSKDEYQLLYILSIPPHRNPNLVVKLIVARALKKGGFGNSFRPLSPSSDTHMRALTQLDQDILHRLEVAQRLSHDFYHPKLYDEEYELMGKDAQTIFEDMLKTGRCYWLNHQDNPPLQLGPAQKGELTWILVENGKQKLVYRIDGKEVLTLPIFPFFYLDLKQNRAGLIDSSLDQVSIKQLLFSPPLEPNDIPKMIRILKDRFQNLEALPMPHQFKVVEMQPITPKPKLFLFGKMVEHFHFYRTYGKAVTLPLGRLSFIYDKTELSIESPLTAQQVDPYTLSVNSFTRNLEAEAKFIHDLFQKGVHFISKRFPTTTPHILSLHKFDILIAEPNNKEIQETFVYQTIPQLQAAGWEVVIDSSFPVEYVMAVDEWFTELHETKDNDWFNMEVGFILNGEKVNILPLLIQLIERMPEKFTDKHLNNLQESTFVLPLPNGKNIKIPVERIKGILSTLSELYDPGRITDAGFLPISYLDATQVIELEKAMNAKALRQLGGERLRELGQKIANFTEIKPITVPKTFQGQLRDYQKKGVDWLNFLREFRLGGILSDDMGLGKTVQTLAHLLIEKEENRLQKPCLIIAPTSLMDNWRSEAKQFTPSLSVLILQGMDRKKQFEHIKKTDIILTTYPLLLRDKEILLEQQYSILILDEAQFAKNANTKSYQILQQLEADHRLCLTGTPMENHLGELWSLFNFLSPGFLGESQQFAKIFRTPIEKYGNVERRKNLNQRIRPYLLRRKKEEVTAELPPKTEIIHKIPLESAQRDLYESIRLSMETKVKVAIQKKGFSGSQIVILDALLKLRQVCCDPRLLSLESAKKVQESAKLQFLMEMLIELVDEGRKILLFSSFASMLKLIEEALNQEKIAYVKLTGSTTDRVTPIQQFQNTNVPIFLISLKAGGTGLNLTAADTVIHYDPWWNPAAEAQATDRAHRIGQTKPVFVYKLITAGTVEEKILLMQNKKRALLSGLFDETKTEQVSTITAADLQYLFQPIDE